MTLLNNTGTVYSPINGTGMANFWTKYEALKDQLILAEKTTLIILAIFTTVGNTLVLVATWRERILHQPNKYFIACLAVADLLVGIILEPLRVYYQNLDDESLASISIDLHRFIVWIDTFALATSILTLTFISFDRYLKISKPLQYRSRMTTSKSLKIIFIIWLISTAFATYAATPNSGSNGVLFTPESSFPQNQNNEKRYYIFIAVTMLFLPTIVILVMYTRIFFVAHKRQKMWRNGELGQTCNNRSQRSAFHQDLKAIRMLLVVVLVFILCWFPYAIFKLLWLHNPNIIKKHSQSLSYWRWLLMAELVVALLPYFNSICNPIIYSWLDHTYRQAFKNLFQRMMCRPSSSRRQPPEAIDLRPLRTR
jgi:hypothetical protein